MEERKMVDQKKKTGFWSSQPAEKQVLPQAGVNEEKRVEFKLFAPQAGSVSVAGTFNQWNTNTFKLAKGYEGTWNGSIRLRPGRYQYRFFVDGKWVDDPNAKQTIQNEFGTKNTLLEVK